MDAINPMHLRSEDLSCRSCFHDSVRAHTTTQIDFWTQIPTVHMYTRTYLLSTYLYAVRAHTQQTKWFEHTHVRKNIGMRSCMLTRKSLCKHARVQSSFAPIPVHNNVAPKHQNVHWLQSFSYMSRMGSTHMSFVRSKWGALSRGLRNKFDFPLQVTAPSKT